MQRRVQLRCCECQQRHASMTEQAQCLSRDDVTLFDNRTHLWAAVQWLNCQQRQVVLQRVSAGDCVAQASPAHNDTAAMLRGVPHRHSVLWEGRQCKACAQQEVYQQWSQVCVVQVPHQRYSPPYSACVKTVIKVRWTAAAGEQEVQQRQSRVWYVFCPRVCGFCDRDTSC
eukprot:GHRQ01036141.1.p1 GENE.GHRQ01036141.1~~GHRQ01036141.1.p1  ORF type:complete len:171 (+),score=5.10 GHRQ01036141.1:151-663(+)